MKPNTCRLLLFNNNPSLAFLWNASDGGVWSRKGTQATYSYAGPQYDASGNSVGFFPAYHPGKGVWVGPAYTNLFAGAPTGAETKTLTAQKYCLQVFGAGSVSCSYGTATVGTPLIFTATAGDTAFTPTGATRWMLSAAGGYVFPYVSPGISVASAAGTSGGNGLSWLMNSRMLNGFQRGVADRVELVSNGGFDSDTTWVKSTGWGISAGALRAVAVAQYTKTSQALSLTAGVVYGYTFTVTGLDGTSTFNLQEEPNTTIKAVSSNGTYSGTFVSVGSAGINVKSLSSGARSAVFDNISIQRLQPSTFTAAALVYMGVGSAEVPNSTTINHITAANIAAGMLHSSIGSVSEDNISLSSDGTTLATGGVTTWYRDEIHLKIVQTNAAGTQFRVGNKRYTSAGVPIDSAIVWGPWTNYDGSMNPLTYLRAAYNGTVPLWIGQVQEWDKGAVSDDYIERIAKRSGMIQ